MNKKIRSEKKLEPKGVGRKNKGDRRKQPKFKDRNFR